MSWKQNIVRRHRKTPDMLSDDRIVFRLVGMIETSLTRDLTDHERAQVKEMLAEAERRGIHDETTQEQMATATGLESADLWAQAKEARSDYNDGRIPAWLYAGICGAAARTIVGRILAEAVAA